MNSIVVVLSQKSQGLEYQNRLEKAVQIFFENNLDYIVLLSESTTQKNINFLKNLGISSDKILLEPEPKDTIGEAFFIKRNILLPYNVNKVYVVSSDYHLEYRAKIIFDFILQNDFAVKYCYSKTEKMHNRKIIIDQLKSLEYFNNLIKQCKGDNLIANHPLYKNKKWLYK